MKIQRIISTCLILASIELCCQNNPSQQNNASYQLIKLERRLSVSFANKHDTIRFEGKKNKQFEPQSSVVKISLNNGHSYNVDTYFSGFGYLISKDVDDSLVVTFRDIPYGELIINGLSKVDQLSNSLSVDRLNCIVIVNGVKGNPKLDLKKKTIDTEKLKESPINEIQVDSNEGNKTFCITKKDISGNADKVNYLFQFNELNSSRLNEYIKITILFIIWLYETN